MTPSHEVAKVTNRAENGVTTSDIYPTMDKLSVCRKMTLFYEVGKATIGVRNGMITWKSRHTIDKRL